MADNNSRKSTESVQNLINHSESNRSQDLDSLIDDFKGCLQSDEAVKVLALFKLLKSRIDPQRLLHLCDEATSSRHEKFNPVAIIWFYARCWCDINTLHEFETRSWINFLQPTLSVLPDLLGRNQTWCEPLKDVLHELLDKVFPAKSSNDKITEDKLFLLTTLLLLLGQSNVPVHDTEYWNRFWFRCGRTFWEGNVDKWKAVWRAMNGSLFVSPFNHCQPQDLPSKIERATAIFSSFTIHWNAHDVTQVASILHRNIDFHKPDNNQNLTTWVNGLFVLSDIIANQSSQIQKTFVCHELLKSTVSSAITHCLSIRVEETGNNKDTLIGIIHQCIAEMLPSVTLSCTERSPLLLNYVTSDHLAQLFQLPGVLPEKFSIVDHVAAKDSASAVAIFSALISKLGLKDMAKLHLKWPRLTARLPKRLEMEAEIKNRVKALPKAHKEFKWPDMKDLHQAKEPAHEWLTEKLAEAIIDNIWTTNSHNYPLAKLCDWLANFLEKPKVENAPRYPCLFHTMLTKAAILKVEKHLDECWTALPNNFHVLFPRNPSSSTDLLSLELVATIRQFEKTLYRRGTSPLPTTEMKRSDLAVYNQFWHRLSKPVIQQVLQIKYEVAATYSEAEQQFQHYLTLIKEVNMIIAWLNNKGFQPPLKEVTMPDNASQSELTKLATISQIDPNCLKTLRFFVCNRSALFNAVFDDTRNESAVKNELSKNVLSNIVDRTCTFLQNLASLANLEKIAIYHTRFRSIFSQEINAVVEFFKGKADIAVDTFEEDLRNSFQLLEFVDTVQYLLQFLKKFDIYSHHWDSLQSISDRKSSIRAMNAKDVQVVLSDIKLSVPSLLPEHFSFFQMICQSKDVIDLLAEFSDEDFNAQVKFLNDQLQGFQHGLDLVTSTVSVRRSLAPLLAILREKKPIPFHMFCKQMAGLLNQGTSIASHSERLHYIMVNLSEVRVNFRGGATLTIEEMLPYVGELIKKGYYTSRTARHRDGADVSFKFREPTDTEDRVFPVASLQELIVAINVFVDQDNIPATKRDQVVQFKSIYELARRIHAVHLALEDTGHPDFQMMQFQLNQVGGLTITSYQEELNRLTKLFADWKQIRQQITGRTLLMSNQQVARLISLLRRNKPNNTANLASYCWKCLPDIVAALQYQLSSDLVASSFSEVKERFKAQPLSISNAIELFALLLENIVAKAVPGEIRMRMEAARPVTELVMALEMDATQIFYALAFLNGEPPHPSQILVCTKQTTESEVMRFVDCSCFLWWLSFVLVEVNNLRMEIRSALIKTMLTLEQKQQRYSLKLLFTSNVGVASFSFVPKQDITKQILGEVRQYLTSLSKHFMPKTVCSRYFKTLEIIQGNPGEGRSTTIRQRFETNGIQLLEIPMQEDFTVARFIQKMEKAIDTGRQSKNKAIGIHLNLTSYIDIQLVHEFLYSWLLFGVIYDSKIGRMFQLPSDFDWHVLVEIGCAPVEDHKYAKLNTPENILTALPALKFVAVRTDKLLDQLVLDDQIRLACAFYRSYKLKLTSTEVMNLQPLANDSDVHSVVASIVQNELTILGDHRRLFLFQRMFLHLLAARCQWMKSHAVDVQKMVKLVAKSGDYVSVENQFFFQQWMKHFITEVAHYCRANVSMDVKSLPVISLRGENSFTLVHYNGTGDEALAKAGVLHITGIQEYTKEPQKILVSLALALGIKDTTRFFNIIRQQRFTMTFDFVVKLLLLNDRRVVGQNVIFRGDTGLGKTETLDLFALVLNCNASLIPDIVSESAQFIARKILSKIKTPTQHASKMTTAEPVIGDILSAIREISNEQYNSTEEAQEIRTYFPIVAMESLGFIRHMLNKYPLIDMPRAHLVKRKSYLVNNVSDLIDLWEEFLSSKFSQLFHKITMHAGMTAEQLRNKISELKDLSAKISQTCPDVKLVVFIDEFNTTSIMGMIKNILFDHRLDGEALPSNIFFAAAMNPYTVKKTTGELDYTGVDNSTKSLPFIVRPNPPTLDLLTVAFSNFDRDQEERFISVLSKTRLDLGSVTEMEIVKDFLLAGQNQLRAANMERIHVSIRDIMRAIDLYVYFSRTPGGAALLNLPEESSAQEHVDHLKRFWHSLFMACNITYCIRLGTTEMRDNLIRQYNRLGDDHRYHESFGKVIDGCYQNLFKATVIPDGVAATKTLMENLFVIVTCIDAKIPVMIIGPAGSSKTLSFTIAADNMRNQASATNLYRSLRHVHPFRYQCTQHSTDVEVDGVYQAAIRRQRSVDNDSTKSTERSTVFLDEANLPDDYEMPLKVLHYHLDHPVVSSVILCNRILDAPKTNRAVVLQQPASLSADDLLALAKGSFYGATMSEYNDKLLGALCAAFTKVNGVTKEFRDKFFQHRDFIYFLRFLRIEANVEQGSRISLTPSLLIRALERNFNGIPFHLFRNVVKLFVEEFNSAMIGKENPWNVDEIVGSVQNRTVQLINENLAATLPPNSSPNLAAFRYMMLLDPTDSEAAVSLFLSTFKREVEVCYVGEFENDVTDEARGNLIRKVTQSMATGKTVLLLNALPIATSFYDLFNRHFSKKPADNSYYAHVAIRSNSRPCIVHPNFKVIVHIPISSLATTHLPFLDRFEKYQLTVDQILQAMLSTLSLKTYRAPDGQKIDEFTIYKAALQHTVDKLHAEDCNHQLFYGVNTSETISSLVYALLMRTIKATPAGTNIKPCIWRPFEVDDDAGSTGSHNVDFAPEPQVDNEETIVDPSEHIRRGVRELNFHLMQVARPEVVFNCRMLPKAYVNNYLLKQEHFNVLRFLKQLFQLTTRTNEVQSKWVIYSRSSALYHKADMIYSAFKEFENAIQVEEFDKIQSSFQCDDLVHKFSTDKSKRALLMLLDITRCTATTVNYLRHQIDNNVSQDKIVVLIMHFPPEYNFDLRPVHEVIYLNDWSYAYIDSIGAKTTDLSTDSDLLEMDTRNWIALGYGLQTSKVSPLAIKSAFKKAFFAQVDKYMARWKGIVPIPGTAYQPATRNQILKDFLVGNPKLYEAVLVQFAQSWSESLLYIIVSDVSKAIRTGSVVDSFASVVLSSMQFLLAPFALGFLRRLYGNGNFTAVQRALKNGSEDEKELILLAIRAIKMPPLKTVLQQNAVSEDILIIDSTFRSTELPYYDLIYYMLTDAYSKARSQTASKESLRTRVRAYIKENVALQDVIQLLDHCEELKDKFIMCFVQRALGFGKLRPTLQEVCKLFAKELSDSSEVVDLLFMKIEHEDKFLELNAYLMPLHALDSDKFDQDLLERLQQAFEFGDQSLSIANISPVIQVVSNTIIDILWEKVNAIAGDRDELNDWQKAFGLLFDQYPSHFHLPSAQLTYSWKYNVMVTALMISQQFKNESLRLFNGFEIILESCEITPSDQVTIHRIINQCQALLNYLNILPSDAYNHCIQRCLHSLLINAPKFFNTSRYLIKELIELCNKTDLPLWNDISFSWKANLLSSLIDVAAVGVKEDIVGIASDVLEASPQHQFVIDRLSTELTAEEATLIGKQITPNLPVISPLESMLFFALLHQSKASNDNLVSVATAYHNCPNESILDQIRRAVYAIRMMQIFSNDISASSALQRLLSSYPTAPISVVAILKKVITEEASVLNKEPYLMQSIANNERLIELLNDKSALEQIGMVRWFVARDTATSNIPGTHLLSFMIDERAPLFRKYQRMKQIVCSSSDEQLLIALNENTHLETKMLLVLVTYYEFFIRGESCPFVQSKVYTTLHGLFDIKEKAALSFLATGPKNIQVEFDPVFLFTAQAQRKPEYDLTLAHLLVNLLAVSMGMPKKSNHLEMRIFSPSNMRGTYCPGSDYNRENRDCGFKYDEKTGKLTSNAKPPIMGDHALKRMALNATTWGALCWTCMIDEGAAQTVLDRNMYLLNYVDDDVTEATRWTRTNVALTPAQKARSYIFRRFTTFFQLFSTNHEIVEQQIQPHIFINEVLLELRSDTLSSPKPPVLQSICTTAQDAVNYEEHMRGIFNRVLNNIKDRQSVFSATLVRDKIFALTNRLKSNLCAFGPIFSFDKFTTVLANTYADQYTELILEFIRNMNSPSLFTCLQYATQLITFYRNVNALFNNRLTTEEVLKPISECIQILKMYESEDVVQQFENSFAAFKKSWKEISHLLITLDPEACAGQTFELEMPKIEDDTPFVVLISDPSDPRCMDSIIKVLTTLFNRQDKLLSLCDTLLPDTRPNPVPAEWLPLENANHFMLLSSVDLDNVKHFCVSQLAMPANATHHFPHNAVSMNPQQVAMFFVRLLQFKPVIIMGQLKQMRFRYKIVSSEDFSETKMQAEPVVKLVTDQLGVNPIHYRAHLIRSTSKFAVPLGDADKRRVKQLLNALSEDQFSKLCSQLADILTWLKLPSEKDKEWNGSSVDPTVSLHLLAKEALQFDEQEFIGPMSFASCHLKDIALLVVDYHKLRSKLFQYPDDLDEELSDLALKKLESFAVKITQKKEWFKKISQLLNAFKQRRDIENTLEDYMYTSLHSIVKKSTIPHGLSANELAEVMPLEVQARNFGAYLRHMYRLCGELSFCFSPTESTTQCKDIYTEYVPIGVIASTLEDSEAVPVPNYQDLEEERQAKEIPNLITEFNAPSSQHYNEPEARPVEQVRVTGTPREIPKLIKNIGNTCYMSSVLQVLTALPEILSIGLSVEALDMFTQLLHHVYISDTSDTFYPQKFQTEFEKKVHNQYKIGQQHDAHEFMVHLMNSLPTSISDLFKIELSYSITCRCKHAEGGNTVLFDLPLDIKSTGPKQVKDMLKMFIIESISEWTCPSCKQKHHDNVKRYRITKLPKILVLVFKRFQKGTYYHTKDTSVAEFPLQNLKMDDVSDDFTSFNLVGSVVHSGSLDQGHYYSCFIRNSKWYRADDLSSTIESLAAGPSADDINGSYIVFYSPAVPSPTSENDNNSSTPDPSQQLPTNQPVNVVVPNDLTRSQPTATNNSLLASSVVLGQKIVTIRKLDAKRGGAEVVNPTSIQELLTIGGAKLKIQAVNVRREKTEAEIDDVNTIEHKEVVYLTTAEEEKEF